MRDSRPTDGPRSVRRQLFFEHMPLPERISEFLCRYSTAPQGSSVGVAVSGGSDSTALLHLLVDWARGNGCRVCVLHFNHGLRAEASDADEQFVRGMAERLGLACEVGRADAIPTANVEAWARRERLKFFAEVKQRLGLAWIATGHTRDDQAETVLLRLLRGSGISGLAGILPVTREGLVRPLLGASREELRDWLRARDYAWREDASNSDVAFAARNRMRLELLPELREKWNPQISSTLAHLAEIAAAEEEYWAGLVAAHAPKTVPEGKVFDAARLRALEPALLRRVLRAAIEASQTLRRIEFGHIEAAVALVGRERGDGRVELPRGGVVERSFGEIRVGGRMGAEPQGVTVANLPPGGWPNGAYNNNGYYVGWDAGLSALELRGWRPGDRFQPRGENASAKMKDLFQTARVPVWKRRSWPVLVSAGQVVWARGLGVAEGWAAGPGSAGVVEVVDTARDEEIVRRMARRWNQKGKNGRLC